MDVSSDQIENDREYGPTSLASASYSSGCGNDTSTWYYSPDAKKKHQRTSVLSRLRSPNHSSQLGAIPPPTTLPTGPQLLHQIHQQWRQQLVPSMGEQQGSAIRSTFTRSGQVLRRQRSRFIARIRLMDETAQFRSFSVSETCQRPQHSPSKRKNWGENGPIPISSPFEFRHITHTHPLQFENLDLDSHNDLITEFTAIRASQRPRTTLQGIRAADIYSDDHRIDTTLATEDLTDDKRSNLPSRTSLPSTCFPAKYPSISSKARSSRSSSVQNFSRPQPASLLSDQSLSLPRSTHVVPPSPISGTELSNAPDAVWEAALIHDISIHERSVSRLNPCVVRDTDVSSKPSHKADTAITRLTKQTVRVSALRVVSGSSLGVDVYNDRPRSPEATRHDSSPLRRFDSLASVDVLSQECYIQPSMKDTDALAVIPELLLPQRTSSRVNLGDRGSQSLVEGTWNPNGGNNAVLLGESRLSSACSLSEIDRVMTSISNGNLQSLPKERGLQECCQAPVLHNTNVPEHLSHDPTNSTEELNNMVSSYIRNQPASNLLGCHPWPKTAPKPAGKLRILSHDLGAENGLAFAKDEGDITELVLTPELCSLSEYGSSDDLSLCNTPYPPQNRHRSYRSTLSSTTSTIQTCRSSNSLGSVPDLVLSNNSSCENVMIEEVSPSASSDYSKAETRSKPPPVPCLPPVTSLTLFRNSAKPRSTTAPVLGSRSISEAQESRNRRPELAPSNRKTTPADYRPLPASSTTPGCTLGVRPSYSIFPQRNPGIRSP